MKYAMLLAALGSSLSFAAQPPEPPNQPVYRSGPWFVVRSVRADTVVCTGFYSANPRVQLTKDTLVIETADDVKGVAFTFDDQAAGAPRPLSANEKDLKAVAFTGEDFAKLSKSYKVRIDSTTAQGVMRHEFDLNGLAGALENIKVGCPVQALPKRGKRRS
jgi:hypothetical protein